MTLSEWMKLPKEDREGLIVKAYEESIKVQKQMLDKANEIRESMRDTGETK